MTGLDALFRLVDLQPEDDVVIVSDSRSETRVAHLAFERALAHGADASWSRVRARDRNGDELPRAIQAAVRDSDLVLLLTSWSASHSTGIIEAMTRGARVMSMPGLTMDMVTRGAATADYSEVKTLTDRWGEHLARGREIAVTTKLGTELRAQLGGWDRLPLLDGGPLPRGAAGLGNFPAGEAAISPIEGTAEGRVVIDRTMSTTPAPLRQPIVLTVEGGIVTDITGGREAEQLERFLDEADDGARVIAEIALGTNAGALHVGVILEDEKALGTAHVGLGNATGFGGLNESSIHVDGVFSAASVTVDDVPLLVHGQVTPEGLAREAVAELPSTGGDFVAGPFQTEVRDGLLYVQWHDVRGFPVWSQVGDESSARAAAGFYVGEAFHVEPGSDAARLAELLALYRVTAAGDVAFRAGASRPSWSDRGI
jgi:leucyl aminopeptidase (aminopeptidase T)